MLFVARIRELPRVQMLLIRSIIVILKVFNVIDSCFLLPDDGLPTLACALSMRSEQLIDLVDNCKPIRRLVSEV